MKTEVLIVLGSINSPIGELNQIALDRLNYCKRIYSNQSLVLCTGGWGAKFNTARNSHASYAKSYLKELGILESDFLELAISSHTVEDAVRVKPIIARYQNFKIKLITSDFHLPRVKYIFDEIIKNNTINYMSVPSSISKEDYEIRNQHEIKALESIKLNGLYY